MLLLIRTSRQWEPQVTILFLPMLGTASPVCTTSNTVGLADAVRPARVVLQDMLGL